MNERITELYVQANKYAQEEGFKKYDKAGDVNWKWEDTVFEKFAELIVRECVNRGSVLATHYIEKHTEQEQTFLLAAVADYSTEIKKHFGVEE